MSTNYFFICLTHTHKFKIILYVIIQCNKVLLFERQKNHPIHTKNMRSDTTHLTKG